MGLRLRNLLQHIQAAHLYKGIISPIHPTRDSDTVIFTADRINPQYTLVIDVDRQLVLLAEGLFQAAVGLFAAVGVDDTVDFCLVQGQDAVDFLHRDAAAGIDPHVKAQTLKLPDKYTGILA